MSEKIIRNIGGCEVTITFKGHNEEVKDKVLWLLMKNYISRIFDDEKNHLPDELKKTLPTAEDG